MLLDEGVRDGLGLQLAESVASAFERHPVEELVNDAPRAGDSVRLAETDSKSDKDAEEYGVLDGGVANAEPDDDNVDPPSLSLSLKILLL